MDQKVMDQLCKLIEHEIEDISKKPSLDVNTLNQLHILTDTKKNLLKIETLEMENGYGEDEGYSRRGMSYRGGSYAQGYGGNSMNGNSYYQGQGGGNSNTYMPSPYYNSYDNGYSRGDAYSHLEQAMRDARSEAEREEIRQLMARYPR